MKLYHCSNKKIEDKIKVDKFGSNSYTFNDKKIPINRSFFYTDKNIPEYHLKNCKYCYIVEVDKNKIYNLNTDKNNLKSKFTSIYNLLQYIKENYIGCKYSVGFEIVSLFKNRKFSKKIRLRD